MVQDYQYLNEWIVKNNYPLPFILDIIKNIGTKKMFKIPEGLFEPTVMFFDLTNLPAMFQTMMNDLLRDLINIGKVESLINNMMVGTKSEEGYDELCYNNY